MPPILKSIARWDAVTIITPVTGTGWILDDGTPITLDDGTPITT
jgi:hypothetical protein